MLKSLFPWKHHKTKAMAAQQTMDDVVPHDQPHQPLLPCHVCGRTFLPAPLKKHERVCEKSTSKKRKPFDSLRQRVEGTDLADFHQKTYLKKTEPVSTPEPKKTKQNNWKEKHLELVNTIRAAKGVAPTDTSPTKTKSTTSLMAGNERCPSCDRQFGPKAYDRHVEWCKEKKAHQRIQQSPANVLRAKERLEARTKYVPPLNRSKKTVVREKYSNHNSTSTETLVSVKSTSPLSRGPSVRKPRSEVTLGRSSDRTSNNEEAKEKTKVEKCVGGTGDKLKRQESLVERHAPVIGSQSSKVESGKNFQKKKTAPFMKINNVAVNHQVDGISVSCLKFDYTNKKMVTWRDTVCNMPKNCVGEKNVAINSERSARKNCPNTTKSDGNCNSTQSVHAVVDDVGKINCEKILSSNDVLHKEQHTKIPLAKHAFTKKINTSRLKGKIENDEEIDTEAETTSSDRNNVLLKNGSNAKQKVVPLSKRSVTKNVKMKKSSKKISNRKENGTEVGMTSNESDRSALNSSNLSAKNSCKNNLTKKGNKIGKSVKNKEVVAETLDELDTVAANSPIQTSQNPTHIETLDEQGTITTNSPNQTSQNPTHILKSSFSRTLNLDKFTDTPVKSEDVVEVDGGNCWKTRTKQIVLETPVSLSKDDFIKKIGMNSHNKTLENSNEDNYKVFDSVTSIVNSEKDILVDSFSVAKSNIADKTEDKIRKILVISKENNKKVVSAKFKLAPSHTNIDNRVSEDSIPLYKFSANNIISKEDSHKLDNSSNEFEPIAASVESTVSLESIPLYKNSFTEKIDVIKFSEETKNEEDNVKSSKRSKSATSDSSIDSEIYLDDRLSLGKYNFGQKLHLNEFNNKSDNNLDNKDLIANESSISLNFTSSSTSEETVSGNQFFLTKHSFAKDILNKSNEKSANKNEDINSIINGFKTSISINSSSSSVSENDIPFTKKAFAKNKILNEVGSKTSSGGSKKYIDSIVNSYNSSVTSICSGTNTKDSLLGIQNQTKSCSSVTEAFEKLNIDSQEKIQCEKSPIVQNVSLEKHIDNATDDGRPEKNRDATAFPFTEENHHSTLDLSNKDAGEDVEETKQLAEGDLSSTGTKIFDCFRNTHREFTDWFEDYMKKAEANDEETLDDEVEYPIDRETQLNVEENTKIIDKPENLVFLFKSTTDLDLTGETSDYAEKKLIVEEKLQESISEETINTRCELDSFELDQSKMSNFSLRKSLSEIDVTNTSSILGLNNKNTLISIYSNKNKENFDVESTTEIRKIRSSSLPSIHLHGFLVKNNKERKEETNRREKSAKESHREDLDSNKQQHEKQAPFIKGNKNIINKNETLDEDENCRRKILELAAEEFIEDCNRKERVENLTHENQNLKQPYIIFQDEEYTVPKKKRKVDSTERSKPKLGAEAKIFPFPTLNFDINKFKALTISANKKPLHTRNNVIDENAMGDFVKKADVPPLNLPVTSSSNANEDRSEIVENKFNIRAVSKTSSEQTINSSDYSPRVVTILDKIFSNCNAIDDLSSNKALIVVTPADCLKLVDLDKNKLPKIKKHLEKIKDRHKRTSTDKVKLPPISNQMENVSREDKEIQAVLGNGERVHLPTIADRRLKRRENLKKCNVDIKKDVKDVYLEYDSESGNFTYDPFESAQRQFMELLECDDLKSVITTSTPVKHTPRPHTTSNITPLKQPSPTTKKKTIKSAPNVTKVAKNTNRASVIDPPNSFKDSLDSFTDDFELMENLINDQFTDSNKNINPFYLHLKSNKESLTLSDILDNRKYSDDMSCIDPRLINENDNLSIPEHFKIDDYSPTSTTDTDITIQNEVDHYSVQYDKKISAFESKLDTKSTNKITPTKSTAEKKPIIKRSVSLVNRSKTDENSLKVTSKKLTNKTKLTSKSVSSVATSKTASCEKKKGLSTLRKSMTLFDPVPKPPSLKNKNDVNNYFSEQEQKTSMNVERNSPEKELSDTLEEALKPEDLFAVDDEMYEEYKKYEEMYLKEKSQASTKKKQKPKMIDINFGILTASEEEEHLTFNNKISNDSAYGSLTRKTPKHRSRATKLTPLEQKQVDSTSSSGSENCPNSPAVTQRLSKFCHDCGNKYPLTTAKFCVECGVKRLVL